MLMWLSALGDSHGGGANTNQHPCICVCPSWEDLGDGLHPVEGGAGGSQPRGTVIALSLLRSG